MRTILACVSLGLVSLSALIFVLLHVVDRRTDPIERTLSEYALGSSGWLFPFAVFAVAAAAGLVAFVLRQRAAPVPALALILLVVFAVAMVVTGIARTDAMDPRAGDFTMSLSGAVHASAGFIAIVSLCAAAPMLTGTLAAHGASRVPATVAGWVPTSAAVVFVATVVAREPIHRLTGRVSLHGIGERFGFAGFLVWIAYAALTLALARKP